MPQETNATIEKKGSWTPERIEAQRQRMRALGKANKGRKKTGESEHIYNAEGDGKKTNSPPKGQHRGINPEENKAPDEQGKDNSENSSPKVLINPEKFKSAWPKILMKSHRFIDKGVRGVGWVGNRILKKYFPEFTLVMRLDEYTNEEAILDSELSFPFVETRIPQWAQNNPIKSVLWVILVSWLGGLKVDLKEEIKPKGLSDGRETERK
jgi:hypothetical protein